MITPSDYVRMCDTGSPPIRLVPGLMRLVRRDDLPVCNVPTEAGWCIRDEHHDGGHLPLPANYPPEVAA